MTCIKQSLHKEASPCAASIACAAAFATIFSLLYLFPERDARADNDAAVSAAAGPSQSRDQGDAADELWAVHGQWTNITQGHSVLSAPYSGPDSLSSKGDIEETTDMTLFVGWRPWHDAEIWMNAEVDQGFGFDDTLGIAGFPNGGAYKVGSNAPYLRLPRAFFRQVIALGSDVEKIDAGPNQLGGTASADNVTVTVGKFGVVDIFDANSYAHDPRADFLNWSVIDGGVFDYAADAWGYTFGAAIEWNQAWWTVRGGFFQLSPVPNGKISRIGFSENSTVVEAEERHQWWGRPGKLKLLAFVNHGSMANYLDAVRLGAETDSTPDVSLARQVGSRPGVVANLEQELSSNVGVFARISQNRGDKEAYEFSDINKSLSTGLSLKGELWNRQGDTIGIAAVVNALSGDAQQYFAAGGLGLLIGDGRLNYAPEKILETYYSLHCNDDVTLDLDYQYVDHPAYNQDRGPVSIVGARLHAAF